MAVCGRGRTDRVPGLLAGDAAVGDWVGAALPGLGTGVVWRCGCPGGGVFAGLVSWLGDAGGDSFGGSIVECGGCSFGLWE